MTRMQNAHAKSELWERGVLSWKFHPGQETIEKAYQGVTAKLFVGNCARRYGKTTWAIIKAIECAIKSSKAKIIIATAFQTDCEEIMVPIFQTVLEDCPSSLLPIFNKTKKKYVFKNQSEIQLVGLDKHPNAGRGRKISLYIIDECSFVSGLRYVYSSVIIPMTMFNPSAKVILISTPPTSPEHPFKEFCEKAKAEDAYVELTIHQNPMCSLELIAEYRKECLTESDFLREYECKFVTDENLQLVPEFNENKHVTLTSMRDEFYPFYRKYVCFDIGVVDPTAFIFGYFDWKKQKLVIEFEDQLQHREVTTKNIDKVLRTSSDYTQFERQICDSNNLVLVNDLNIDFQHSVVTTTKEDLLSMVAAIRLAFQQDQIVVSAKCKNLISQLKYGIWNKHKTSFERMNNHHHDFIAAIVYLWRMLCEYQCPIPQTYGYTENTWNPNLINNDGMSKIFDKNFRKTI